MRLMLHCGPVLLAAILTAPFVFAQDSDGEDAESIPEDVRRLKESGALRCSSGDMKLVAVLADGYCVCVVGSVDHPRLERVARGLVKRPS